MDGSWTGPEPIEGWRGWHLAFDADGPVLVPVARGAPWPRRRPVVARCLRRRRHRAPEVTCTCGVYAVRDRSQLVRARSPAVVGPVALWGRIVVHATGWRAELAYPQMIGLVCAVCAISRDITGAQPGAVAAYRDRSLVPLCERHLRIARTCGRDRFEVLPLQATTAALADGYAVEPILI